MQEQHHINMHPRSRKAEICGEYLVCVLDFSNPYSLTGAYGRKPHLEFLNLKSGRGLVNFVRDWGPLSYLEPGINPERQLRYSLQSYWDFQGWLKSLLELVHALKSRSERERLRTALLECISADERVKSRRPFDLSNSINLVLRGQPGDARKWLLEASLQQARAAASMAIQFSSEHRSRLKAVWEGGYLEFVAAPVVSTLQDALEWMLWRDVSGKRPLTLCRECGVVFEPSTAHARKYCSYNCAHRATAREWRRRDLRKKKLKGRK